MAEKKEKAKDIKTPELDIVKRALGRLVETKDGQIFINYLMKESGFNLSSLVMDVNTSEINPLATIYNEARKTLYYKVRGLIKPEKLIEIENLIIKEETTNET